MEIFFAPFVSYPWSTISTSLALILYPTENKALEQGYAQPGAAPYVSLFRTLLTLVQKQEVIILPSIPLYDIAQCSLRCGLLRNNELVA